jgi:hypothetical protein
VRQAKLRAEFKQVDPVVFLSNPQLLKQVKSWIDIASIDYARQSLSKTGVDGPYINTIIEAVLRTETQNPEN